jgi:pimeloyl-ACP methyl ester carboxylesterase
MAEVTDFGARWDDLEAISAPTLLVRGELSRLVDDADVVEYCRRRPDGQVAMVAGAGHSIQGDQPLELARMLSAFVAGT